MRPCNLKILTKAGWANLCLPHYEDHFRIQATKKCNELGLDTVEKKRAWVLEKSKTVFKRFPIQTPVIEREPGEDLEEAECPL
jgi:hypothetical protein